MGRASPREPRAFQEPPDELVRAEKAPEPDVPGRFGVFSGDSLPGACKSSSGAKRTDLPLRLTRARWALRNNESAIAWAVERDVSDYATLLRTGGLNASLSIPNTVNAEYTGVLTMSANVSFYAKADVFGASAVLSVSDPTLAPNPWNAMGVEGDGSVSGSVTLPFQDANRVVVDLYASGHSCDEFWYTNVPGAPTIPGLCGSGAYREFRLYVDGTLAGVAAPFPVVYTGGIDPYLWRPLTGILSFDVPAYRFDVTPFAALFNDGKTHVIKADVVDANNASGVWYLDPVVLAWSAEAPAPLTGAVVFHEEHPLNITVTATNGSAGLSYATSGAHGVTVTGFVEGPMNPVVHTTVATSASIENVNVLVGATRQVTTATIASRAETSRRSWDNATTTTVSASEYPIAVDLNTPALPAGDLVIEAAVDYGRKRSFVDGDDVNLTWSNAMRARALLNESKTWEFGTGSTNETFYIVDSGVFCYARELGALDGSVTSDVVSAPFACDFPEGLRFCVSDVCGSRVVDGAPTKAAAPTGPAKRYPAAPHALLATAPATRDPAKRRAAP